MIKWLALSVGVIIADQVTKLLVISALVYQERVQVLPMFAWVRWHNEGAAFSFLASAGGWQKYFFIALAIGFSAFIVYEISRLPKNERVMGWVYGLILGGAIGNLIDRIYHGYVVDFLLFHYESYYFPAFNLADSALFCGAVLWIIVMIIEYQQSKTQSPKEAE